MDTARLKGDLMMLKRCIVLIFTMAVASCGFTSNYPDDLEITQIRILSNNSIGEIVNSVDASYAGAYDGDFIIVNITTKEI